MEDGGREVGVSSDDVRGMSGCDTGSPDYKGDVDVFLKSTFLAGVKTVLGDVVAVVCGVDDVRIIEDAVFLELGHNAVNMLVHCLKSLEAGTVEVIVILDNSRVQLWESLVLRKFLLLFSLWSAQLRLSASLPLQVGLPFRARSKDHLLL